MKNKIRIKTNTGDIVFDHSRDELFQNDSTKETIFLWDNCDFTRGYTNGIINDNGDICIYPSPNQDEVYFAMAVSRLIAWTQADEQKGGES